MPLRTTRRIVLALTIILTAAAGMVGAAPANAATATGTISGHVLTTAGGPAAGVTLIFSTGHSDAPNHNYSAATDASGEYSVSGVVPEHYTVVLPSDSTWTMSGSASVTVESDAAVTVPTVTVIRLATVHGTVTSAVDGTPIAGMFVSSAAAHLDLQGSSSPGDSTRTGTDGSFTITTMPGLVRVHAGANNWFDGQATVWLDEGADQTIAAIALQPAGLVEATIRSHSGRAIGIGWETAVVDGCRLSGSTPCPGVSGTVATGLQVAPGTHTIRYEVNNPVSSTVRHVTRRVTVQQGVTTTVSPIIVRADPAQLAAVHTSTYRRGHPVTVRVDAAIYTDGARPHLRTTFRVNGHSVVPTKTVWQTSPDSANVLIATLPARWSTSKALKVSAVVHGSTAYAGRITAQTRLTQTR